MSTPRTRPFFGSTSEVDGHAHEIKAFGTTEPGGEDGHTHTFTLPEEGEAEPEPETMEEMLSDLERTLDEGGDVTRSPLFQRYKEQVNPR